MSAKYWIWRTIAAGLCGSLAHSLLMWLKSRAGWLPTFQPYKSLQTTLSSLVGADVHPAVPWLLSFLNGSILVGFIFGRVFWMLPGSSGAIKGTIFGLFGWMLMGLVFFPLLGLGAFAVNVGLGIAPSLFSLAMFMTYSVVLGVVYGALVSKQG